MVGPRVRYVRAPRPGPIYLNQGLPQRHYPHPAMYRPPRPQGLIQFYLWVALTGVVGIMLALMMFGEFSNPGSTARFVEWVRSGQVLRDAPRMVQDVARKERTVVIEEPGYVPATPPPTPYVPMPTSAPAGVPTAVPPNIVVAASSPPVVTDLAPTAEPVPQVTIEALPVIQATADYSDVDPWYYESRTWVPATAVPTIVVEQPHLQSGGITIQPLPPLATAQPFTDADLTARQAEVARLCAENPNQIFCGIP